MILQETTWPWEQLWLKRQQLYVYISYLWVGHPSLIPPVGSKFLFKVLFFSFLLGFLQVEFLIWHKKFKAKKKPEKIISYTGLFRFSNTECLLYSVCRFVKRWLLCFTERFHKQVWPWPWIHFTFLFSHPAVVFHYVSWWIYACPRFDARSIHLCILVGSNVWLTFMSDMLGWIIRLCKPQRNEGPNKWNTCFGDRKITGSLFFPVFFFSNSSYLEPLKHKPVSTLISPETKSICRMGTASHMQDPQAVGTESIGVVPHYFCPF